MIPRIPLDSFLTKVITNSYGNIEYEIRLGYNNNNRFEPGLKIDDFFNLKKNLETKFGKSIDKNEVITYYQDGTRSIFNPINKTSTFYKKEKVKNFDFDIKDLSFRVDLSLETNMIKPVQFAPPSLIKNRISSSYKDPRGFVYDLRQTLPNGPYEVELEYDINTLKKMVINQDLNIYSTLSEITEFFNLKEYFPCYLDFKKQAVTNYENICNYGRIIPGKFHSFNIKKPINLPKNKLSELENYYVMPKLDGIRYFLYFDKSGYSFLVNDKNFIGFKSFKENIKNTIIDGELYHDEFYVFDIINYNDDKEIVIDYKNLRTKYTTDERLKYLNKISDIVKPTPYYKNSMDCILNMVSFYDLKVDGLIFIPQDGYYYSQNYKYKPPKELTIDFYLKRQKDNEYYILSNGPRNELVVFKGNQIMPFSGIVKLKSVIKDSIYEMKWDYTLNTFEIIRERVDKVVPNFITVAQSIWNDIIDPITVDELLKHSITDNKNKDILECFYDIYFENKKPKDIKEIDTKSKCEYINYKKQRAIYSNKNIYFFEKNKLQTQKTEDEKIIIDENFDFSKLSWLKGEFLKIAFVKNISVLLDTEGYIITDEDRLYYKDYLDKVNGYYTFNYPEINNSTDIYKVFLDASNKKEVSISEVTAKKFKETLYKTFTENQLLQLKGFSDIFLEIVYKYFYDTDKIKGILSEKEFLVYENLLLLFNPEEFEELSKDIRSFPFILKDAMNSLFSNMMYLVNNKMEECIEILDVRPYLFKHMKNIVIKILNNSYKELYNILHNAIYDLSFSIDLLKYKIIILSEMYKINMTLSVNDQIIYQKDNENTKVSIYVNKNSIMFQSKKII